MATERGGGGDPRRTLALLWRGRAGAERPPDRPARGRKPRIGLDQVIHAAVEVADAGGLAAVSMARVAERLGVGPMTLYTYVPGKAELVHLMADAVMTERHLPGPDDPARPAGWRAQVEHYADQTRAVHLRHPWLWQVSAARPPFGPGMMAEHEYLLSVLEGAGLPAARLFDAAGAIITFVVADARQQAENAQVERETGQSWDAWWAEHQDLWDEHFDPDNYPTMTRVWVNGGFDGRDAAPPGAHAHGLRWLLDGIQAATQQPGPSTS